MVERGEILRHSPCARLENGQHRFSRSEKIHQECQHIAQYGETGTGNHHIYSIFLIKLKLMFKKLILTSCMAMGLMASAWAQGIVPVDDDNDVMVINRSLTIVEKPYVLSVGPKIGLNYSLAGDPQGMNIGMTGNVGFSVGAVGNIRFFRPVGKPLGTERFGVQLEALYSMHSLKTDTQNITMNCFEIPVLLQWYFLPMFAVEVGPTFTGAFSASPKDYNYNNAVYHMDKMKAYDVMVSFGVNCQLRNGFTADLRYNLGNSDIAGNFQTKVSTISLGIGWLFNVIK